MSFTIMFFLILTVITIFYILFTIKTGLRIPIMIEIFFIIIFFSVLIIVLFPKTLNIFEDFFGVSSALHFIIYLSIFLCYILLFLLYKKSEEQRIEITTIVREIAFLEKRIRDLEKKSKNKKD